MTSPLRRIGTTPIEGGTLTMAYLGIMVMGAGAIMLLPLAVLPFYPSEAPNAPHFIFPGVAAVCAGYLMTLPAKDREWGRLQKGQDALIIALTWVATIALCAIPFVLSGSHNVTQAIFETTSALTTTGLSVTDVANCPHIFLMYRSILLFFGGVGLVLVMVSAISNAHGMTLYHAEGHTDRLLPNLARSARIIVGIYSGYIVAGAVALALAGMPAFDALNHAIAALSTGGFSTQPESIGAYNNVAIEAIIIALMLLGATSFVLHLRILQGRLRPFLFHSETKLMFALVVGASALCAMVFVGNAQASPLHALRIAAFQVVSALTGTGFQTLETFQGVPSAVIVLLTFCMVVGGQAGSTAGGVKLHRVVLAGKGLAWNLRDLCSGRNDVSCNRFLQFGSVSFAANDDVRRALVYIATYCTVLMAGTLVFTLYGHSLGNSLFEFASALGNVGISAGITSADAPDMVLWTATIGMFLGRLEIYPIVIGLLSLKRAASRRR